MDKVFMSLPAHKLTYFQKSILVGKKQLLNSLEASCSNSGVALRKLFNLPNSHFPYL